MLRLVRIYLGSNSLQAVTRCSFSQPVSKGMEFHSKLGSRNARIDLRSARMKSGSQRVELLRE